MKKLEFGVSSMVLGPAIEAASYQEISTDTWENAAVIRTFFRSGGNPVSVTPTVCRFLYSAEKLFVLFECREESSSHKVVKKNTVTELTSSRKDRVELLLSGRDFSRRDFAVFGAERNGQTGAFVERGMTYISGDRAYLGGGKDPQDQGVKHAVPTEKYTAVVRAKEGAWYALFEIPWDVFGGKPKEGGRFELQVYRKKHQSSEILCSTPLDLNVNYSDRFEYDPETFLEVSFGETKKTVIEESIVFTLPSGALHWQRPGVLAQPSPEEAKAIYLLQKSSDPTTMENLSERITLVQRWQDSLTLEGFDFFFNQEIANPWEPMDPWVEKRLVNEHLRAKQFDAAAAELDRYIDFLRTCSSWWYADHSFGNQDAEKWSGCTRITEVTEQKDSVKVSLELGGKTGELVIYPVSSGFRLVSGKKGFFDGKPESFSLEESERAYVLKSGGHSLTMQKDTLELLVDGIAAAGLKDLSFAFDENGFCGSRIHFSIRENSAVYGFGERFDSVNQYGKTVSLWQRDACEGCLASIGNQSYKNIPLVHTSEGFSFFVNSSYRLRIDAGNTSPEVLSVEACGPVFDLYLWPGNPMEAMTAYADLTGFPILPPEWVFEPWAGGGGGRWKHGPMHDIAAEQMSVMRKFDELDIPHSGFYAEGAGADHFGEYKKEELYKVVSCGERHGLKVFSWQFPNMPIEKAQELLPDCAEDELPVTRNGEDPEQKLPVYIDFSHPRAKELLKAQWKDRLDAGIRGSMVDFGDIVPDQAVFYDGRRGDEMHNAYAYQYAKNYRELFEEKYGDDHVLYTRGAAPGSQHFTCQFGGDQLTSFLGLNYAISGGLSAAASGLPFWGVDAGGYDGFPDQETYIRWTEYAAFCPIMRYHGTEPREPWEYDEFTVQIYRFYAWFRENLKPYIVNASVEAHNQGIPVMRPLLMAYPEDTAAVDVWDEYFFGPDLLVAPVSDEREERSIYFPEGKWVSLWNPLETVTGPARITKTVPIDSIPVYVREGGFLPLCLNENLQFGESMSRSKTGAMLIALTETKAFEALSDRSGAQRTCSIEKMEDGYRIQISGGNAGPYFLIAGTDGKVPAVTANGRNLTKVPSREALYFQEGYFKREDGMVILKVNPSTDYDIVCSLGE
ncbi:MAG: glycoside hydrolase family 31 protein [Fusicatenibacter sp.]|nr:glycoside hydrolase family 31 protein [Lachnospiraceae bacterium]MDY2938955.1 glycoside hydrolase family 31 protein [Fusicatenibacter sp.]